MAKSSQISFRSCLKRLSTVVFIKIKTVDYPIETARAVKSEFWVQSLQILPESEQGVQNARWLWNNLFILSLYRRINIFAYFGLCSKTDKIGALILVPPTQMLKIHQYIKINCTKLNSFVNQYLENFLDLLLKRIETKKFITFHTYLRLLRLVNTNVKNSPKY